MSQGNYYNPGDDLGNAGFQIYGVVESIGYGEKDKKKQDGRVLVRLFPQEGTPITTEKLSWLKVMASPQQGGSRGVIGVNHRLTPGTKVMVQYYGQQRMFVTGVAPNDDPNDQYSDLHPFKDKENQHVDPAHAEFEKEWKSFKVDGPVKISAADSRKVNTSPPTPKTTGDLLKSMLKQVPEPKRLGILKGVKSATEKTPETIGGFPRHKGSILNATKAIQQLLGKKGEILPKELQMILSLQQKAKSGGIFDSSTLVGGSKNIIDAIAGIMQLVQNVNNKKPKEEKKDEEELSELEKFLRALYKAETGQEPVDENGKETPQYTTWKRELLLRIEREREEDKPEGLV